MRKLEKQAVAGSKIDYEAYERAAKAVGFECGALLQRDKLAAFLRDENIDVYPYDSVTWYLDHQLSLFRPKMVWYWCPLRPKDWNSTDCWTEVRTKGRRGTPRDGVRAYRKPVPLPVLLTIRKLEDAWPHATDPLRFFVSDFTNVRKDPDPFLAVTVGVDHELLVIERWDEPGFRS